VKHQRAKVYKGGEFTHEYCKGCDWWSDPRFELEGERWGDHLATLEGDVDPEVVEETQGA